MNSSTRYVDCLDFLSDLETELSTQEDLVGLAKTLRYYLKRGKQLVISIEEDIIKGGIDNEIS